MSGAAVWAFGSSAPWSGGDVGVAAHCVLAPNPGPMTLDGTNTWVLSAPGSDRAVVIDPGPDDAAHLRAVREAVERRGCRSVAAVLLTHGHADHSAGAGRFARSFGIGVRALDPAHRLGSEGLAAGDALEVGDLRVDVVATPGHTGDSLCFVLGRDAPDAGVHDAETVVLTGDTVLGRGTAVIYHPDGVLADYLASLRRLEALATDLGCRALLPGHGPVLDDPVAVLAGYHQHRLDRLDEVQAALNAGARTASEVVGFIYADVNPRLWPAAERSVRAALAYLDRAAD